jgi:hypothetical protein
MDYSNVLTDLTWIFVIVATILILIEFRWIIEDFSSVRYPQIISMVSGSVGVLVGTPLFLENIFV